MFNNRRIELLEADIALIKAVVFDSIDRLNKIVQAMAKAQELTIRDMPEQPAQVVVEHADPHAWMGNWRELLTAGDDDIKVPKAKRKAKK